MATILTDRHRENLAKLAAYLESLPADYSHFRMSVYYTPDHHDWNDERDSFVPCGTAACAVGHGPAAGIGGPALGSLDGYADQPIDSGFVASTDWDDYSNTHLCPIDAEAWYFLFDSRWLRRDNTHQGAAARIRHFLVHGVPPREEWYTGPWIRK